MLRIGPMLIAIIIKPFFDDIRYHCDKLELLVDDELWTLAKYRELCLQDNYKAGWSPKIPPGFILCPILRPLFLRTSPIINAISAPEIPKKTELRSPVSKCSYGFDFPAFDGCLVASSPIMPDNFSMVFNGCLTGQIQQASVDKIEHYISKQCRCYGIKR